MKRNKLIMSIIACCFALSVLAFGVYASLSVNFNLSGKISFDPHGVDATITTQVFKYTEDITHDDAYIKACDLQGEDFETLESSYAKLTEQEEYLTKEGNTYNPNLEQDLSESVLNFEDCNAYFIVVHVLPNESYDLEQHNQIVFVELTEQTLPDNVWLAYNDKYLVIYPSAQQDGGLSMVFFIGITEPYTQVPENNFSLNLCFEYKDIYQLGENDTIEEPWWDNAGPDDVYIQIEQLWDEDDNYVYSDEIVLPETIEYENTQKNVVALTNNDGNELYCNKLILNKNCSDFMGEEDFGYAWKDIKDYFIVDQRNEKISSLDNMLFNKDKTILIYASDSYISYTIPSFVEEINNYYVFCDCEKLEKVVIPEGITKIPGQLFTGCSSLSDITIPDSVTSIGDRVFYNCSSLTNIIIPDSVTNIEDSVFYNCSSLTNITLPDSVTSIGRDAFKGCNESIFTIDSIYGGKYIKSKSNEYFALVDYDDTVNTEFILNKNCNVIGESVCSRSNITSFDFNGANIKEIPEYMFFYCSLLTSITISNNVTNIDGCVFDGCTSLTNIKIPDSVTSIGQYAFENTNLSSIYIPASVQTMGSRVFADIKNSNFKIYCGANEQPVGWDSDWNKNNYREWTDITWGVTREDYNG